MLKFRLENLKGQQNFRLSNQVCVLKTEIKTMIDINTLCETLKLKKGEGLEFVDKKSTFPENSFFKSNIDAVYSIPSLLDTKMPVIYFKEMTATDEEVIMDLHRKVWNEGRTPFLILVLPTEIRVYNTFVPTQRPKSEFDENALVQTLTLYQEAHENIEKIRKELTYFSKEEIETGEFWRNKFLKFDKVQKIDVYLLSNLKILRHKLSKQNLPFDIINKIIVRSIFISYMQDRGILTEKYFQQIDKNYSNYTDVLRSKKDTYVLFKVINSDFDGDAFNIAENEETKLRDKHLKWIRYFLLGAHFDERTDKIQMSLFPYCFDVIPIELISSIYEEFLRSEGDSKSDSHYTPHHLVMLSLDAYYKNKSLLGQKTIDPACGSGTFLVDTYRRIVEEWYKKNDKMPNWSILKELLLEHIYGIDIKENAVRAAIFSLYLKMLDYLQPKDIWKQIKLPCLYNRNLFHASFFNDNSAISNMRFDYFIGNPPWRSLGADSPPVQFCTKNGYPISDNQMAQAFIWKIHSLASSDSSACLVLPSKSILFNKSETNKRFRKHFLDKHNIKLIINISSLRHGLFHNAVGPAIIAIYSFNGKSENILYISPKSSSENNNSSYIIINSVDAATIPRKQFISNENIWKIAMWGASIDGEIISKISRHQKLEDVLINNNFIYSEGLQKGGGDNNGEPRLKGMLLADARTITSYHYNTILCEKIQREIFHRPRSKNFEIYLRPHILIRKNKLIAVYLDKDIAFTHAIFGVHGEKVSLLKYISVLINSELMKYYFFLTASAWAVERNNIHTKEIKDMPVAIPRKSELYSVVKLHDKIQSKLQRKEDPSDDITKLNELIYNIYSINDIERMVIEDTLTYSLSIFEKGEKSIAYEKISKTIIEEYTKTVSNHVNRLLKYNDKFINGKVHFSNGPLSLVAFSIDDDLKDIEFFEDSYQIEFILSKIEKSLGENYSRKISLNKNLRLYQKERIILVKLNERRLWSKKQAIIDANQLISEIIIGEQHEHA